MCELKGYGLDVLKGEEKFPLHYRSNTIQRLIYEGIVLLSSLVNEGEIDIPDYLDKASEEYITLLPSVLEEVLEGEYSQEQIKDVIIELDEVYLKVNGVRFNATSNLLTGVPSYRAIEMALISSVDDLIIDTYKYKNEDTVYLDDFVNSLCLTDIIEETLSKKPQHAPSCKDCNVCEDCKLKDNISNCLECEVCYNCRNNDLDYKEDSLNIFKTKSEDAMNTDFDKFLSQLRKETKETVWEDTTCGFRESGLCDDSLNCEKCNTVFDNACEYLDECDCGDDCHDGFEFDDVDEEAEANKSYAMSVEINEFIDKFNVNVTLLDEDESMDCIFEFNDSLDSIESMVDVLLKSKIATAVMISIAEKYSNACAEFGCPKITFITEEDEIEVCSDVVEIAMDVMDLLD